ncbi:transglutaminase family protein [Salimicrobium flavidum]|uniref:Transglutaminase-like enzyme, putative cysteine protease n=1 Tax=Salimicrobium flavidum TaxID=570947 RepID=A0A1N7J8B9_9BACI|nr:transglutaminase family protein [Salimicrobium flavidum]SIS45569.1 Transglutaminase-like enzyme, putative cysteine protease [Salimicrobium flavidum]
MKYQIEHTNTINYDNFVDQSMNHIRLKPRSDECQRVLAYKTEITPLSMTKEHLDMWGNHVETFFIPEKHEHLTVKTMSTVSIQKSPLISMIHYSDEMKEIFHSSLFRKHYLAFLNETPYTFMYKEQIAAITKDVGDPSDPVQFPIDLMKFVHDTLIYNTWTTNVDTKAYEAWPLQGGVCQDFAHIMIAVLRANGIPARYASGYLYIGENSALVGDAATHAWVEVMIPGIGWVGLDPTNNVEALENHIRIGTGRDYADVSPLQGVYRGGGQNLDVKVNVTLIDQ